MSTSAQVMIAFNVVIAAAYLLNGMYFAGRFRAVVLDDRAGSRRRHPLHGVGPSQRPIWLAAQGAAAVFFVLCATTHIELAFHTYRHDAGWLTSWHMVIVHGIQGPAGILFWFLASRYLNLELTSDIHKQEQALLRSEAQRRLALGKLIEVEEEQRNRIAHDLHDDTVQVMAATLYRLELAARGADDTTRRRIEVSTETLRAALDRTRKLMFDLRPPVLHEQGLTAAVQELARQLGRETGAEVECEVTDRRLPVPTEQLVYRSIREAVANVRKHAAAHRVEIVVDVVDNSVFGTVADDGGGFEVAAQAPAGHMGLSAARERIDVAGGALEVMSHPGGGTVVSFRIPVMAEREPMSLAV